MEVMRIPYKDAIRKAEEAQIIYHDWIEFNPKLLADHRAKLWKK